MRKLLMIQILLLTVLSSLAATDQYLLYHVNKEVHWLHDGMKEKAKRGMFVKANQSLLINEQSDVMIIQQDGKSLLLNKTGTYTYAQLKSLFSNVKKSTTSASFFSYVFEKFLSGNGKEEKQNVGAFVFRGKQPMQLPQDSVFVFTNKIKLTWKPEQANIPYKIQMIINGNEFDTVIHKQNSLLIPEHWLPDNTQTAVRISWTCSPTGSKQEAPHPFLLLLPKKEDYEIIQQQLKQLQQSYAGKKQLLRIMEKDLLERWLELYQLNE